MPKDKIKWGIIGIGAMGADHAHSLNSKLVENAALQAICDIDNQMIQSAIAILNKNNLKSPAIYYDGPNDYINLLNQVKSSINGSKLFDITVGVFRMGKDYFQRVRKSKPESLVYYQNYEI